MNRLPIISALYIYPIKSCRGISLQSALLDAWGLQYDRNWMIVTPAGHFLTQRQVPQLALIETAIEPDNLRLSAPGMPDLAIPLLPQKGDILDVVVWHDQCQAVDQGEEAATWLSQFLQLDCRLVRIGEQYDRPVDAAYAKTPAQVSFADGYPLLMISEASLQDLNRRLAEPLPMNRFRPNLVVAGCAAYAEDSWQQMRIGQVIFEGVKLCTRCVITTTDQATAVRHPDAEPLKTLATYRRVEGGVAFGQNVIHRQPAEVKSEVKVGSPIEVLR